ncbi:MAG: hypothetical protein JOS17DRAFT_134866 [Linnemannia elongata]|nr:MAG: hypothetical protein JOS17DRAFT_134866 [Linnemannia elongata]
MQRRIDPTFEKDHRQHRTEQGVRSRQEKGVRRGPTTSYSLPQQQQLQQQQQQPQPQRQQHQLQQHQHYQQQPSALTQIQPPTFTQSKAPSHTPPTPLPLTQHTPDTQQSPKSTPPTISTDQRQITSMDRQGVGPTVSKCMGHLPTTIATTSSKSETSGHMLNMSHPIVKVTSTADRTRPEEPMTTSTDPAIGRGCSEGPSSHPVPTPIRHQLQDTPDQPYYPYIQHHPRQSASYYVHPEFGYPGRRSSGPLSTPKNASSETEVHSENPKLKESNRHGRLSSVTVQIPPTVCNCITNRGEDGD